MLLTGSGYLGFVGRQALPRPGPLRTRLNCRAGQLDSACVVLVAPKHASNIGSAARALANFEVSDLRLVSPRCDPFCSDAYKTACNSPAHERLQTFEGLQEALADTTGSIGFTRRTGATRNTHASIRHLLQEFPHAFQLAPGQENELPQADLPEPAAPKSKVALVFGREESGLADNELASCSHACAIPTGDTQPSLNLSHAVCVVLSQLWDLQAIDPMTDSKSRLPSADAANAGAGLASLQPVDAAALNALVDRWKQIIAAAGLRSEESVAGGQGNHGRKRRTAGHLRAVFNRAQVNKQEAQAWHGLAKAIVIQLEQNQQQPLE